jgi:ribulose-phosphate 3-epimerase
MLSDHSSQPANSDACVLMAPSILSADFLNLGEDVAKVAPTADFIHVDVMDGHFTPNLTIGPAFVESLKHSFNVRLDVHLMVDNPEQTVDWYLDRGADLVTVHLETLTHANRVLTHIRERGALAGVAVNPATPICLLREVVQIADLILVMSVNPGFGGQSFISTTPRRLDELCALCDDMQSHPLIEVDGGINTTTAPEVVSHGARVLVAGSAVFGADDPERAMESIRRAGEGA